MLTEKSYSSHFSRIYLLTLWVWNSNFSLEVWEYKEGNKCLGYGLIVTLTLICQSYENNLPINYQEAMNL